MEILAYIAIAVILLIGGMTLSRYLERKYDFETFSLKSIGLLALTAIAWILTYYYFDPNGNDNVIINIFAYAFVICFDALVPLYLLIVNIRKTNLFWGVFAFLYQMIVTLSAVILVLLVFDRFSNDE